MSAYEFYSDALIKGLKDNKENILNSFSQRASMSGWPEEVISNIDMTVDDGNISLSYAQSMAEKISNLEYGTTRQPARAAVRNFTSTAHDDVMDIFAEHGINALFKRKVFE